MIVDTVEDVGKPGLRIEAVHLCGFDERHRSGERLATAIGACKEPAFRPMPIGRMTRSAGLLSGMLFVALRFRRLVFHLSC